MRIWSNKQQSNMINDNNASLLCQLMYPNVLMVLFPMFVALYLVIHMLWNVQTFVV
jgi:hypothetical protein